MPLSISALVFSLAVLVPAVARADHDMSGRWLVVVTQPPGTVVANSQWDVVQDGSDISLFVGATHYYDGTIDIDTGDFEFVVDQPYPECGTNTLTGNVAADGKTLSGLQDINFYGGGCHPTLGCNVYCVSGTLTLDGGRCGNQQIDDGEDCDDGNREDGDCCSSSCTIDTVGTSCTADYNICTDDVCDGAGTCEHIFNTTPCADPDGCGTGACSDGSCEITAPEPAGTPCDGPISPCRPRVCDGTGGCGIAFAAAGTDCDTDTFDCTSAACDDAGQCIVDDETTCAPCGVCGGSEGCVLDTGDTCDVQPRTLSIALRVGEPDNQRLSIKLKDSISSQDLGDPTASTEYTVCLYENDNIGSDRVISELVVPPAGTCGDQPCWEQRSFGFSYDDESLANDGVESMKLAGFKGIWIKGSGPGLPLPTEIDPAILSIYPKIIANDGVTRKCWTHDVFKKRARSDSFTGRY